MQHKTATDEIWQGQPGIIRKFLSLRPKHEKLCEEIAYILRKLLSKAVVEYSKITWRAKSLDSFCEKIVRKKYKNQLKEVADLSGVRIVYLYESDRSVIEDLIEDQFQIIEKVDRIKKVGTERFGYGALHYLVKLSKQSIGARYDDLKDLVCELQVRTVLQDAWAIVAHHLSYKKESDVPEELRRKLNALSGLFETADDQFDLLRNERIQYAKNIKSDISSKTKASLNKKVNLDNLAEFLKWRFPDLKQEDREHIADLLHDIKFLGYTTLVELDTIVDQTSEAVKAYESKYPPSDTETGEACKYSAIGVMRSSLKYVNRDFRNQSALKEEIEEFLDLVKSASSTEQTASRRRGKPRA